MKATVARCAASSQGRQRFRPSWLSPGLTSHQQLDAGIAARQHAGRKALKKSKRPFENYFRTQFRLSPRVRLPVTQSSGVMSSHDAVKMVTDPGRTWNTPWGRAGAGVRTRRKRQDVLESTPTQFGEDAIDRVLEQLIEIRFAWDREDGVLCTSLVPDSLYGTTTHCRPYITEVAPPAALTSSTALLATGGDAHTTSEHDEVVMIAGTPVHIKRRTPRVKQKSGQPKRPQPHSSLGFSGVDTVPSLVLDVSHGPFVTATNAPLMTLRWKGEHRDAASAQSVLQLLRRIRGVPVVGLSPPSSLLLLKALATVEVEEPALAVSLAIAVGENYHGYADAECLEALRCLRRLALVRELPDVGPSDIHAATVSSYGAAALPALYTDASLTGSLLSHYVRNAAPFLASKIWSRLPEQSRHLLQRGYFLDWFDLMRLAISASEPRRLPSRLPNAVTEAPYAAKYMFFHHTLGLNEEVLCDLVLHLRDIPSTSLASWSSPVPPPPPSPSGVVQSPSNAASSPHFVDAVKEEVDKPLILWLCASMLTRIAAECLGDIVRHVGDSLHQHAALAAERAEERRSQEERELRNSGRSGALSSVFPHPFPRLDSGRYQRIGHRRPKRVRVRLLPFEAFPRVAHSFSCPFASVTQRAEATERQRQRRRRVRDAPAPSPGSSQTAVVASLSSATAAGGGEVQSAFASVLAESPRMVKHVERASSALAWSTTVLRACHALVRDLPLVAAPALAISARDASASSPNATEVGKEADDWARDTVAMEVRHALCYRYVRSCVELDMDALFSFIPWNEMERQWEPMLAVCDPLASAGNAGGTDLSASKDSADAADDNGQGGGDQRQGLSAEDLAAALGGDQPEAAAASENSASSTVRLSEEEQRARAMMGELRERLEEFQVAVADVLEAHERFFDPSGEGTPASSL